MAVEEPTAIRAEGAPEHPVLSIIVPVYKLGNYLDACLDSLQAQAFGDIEMVCVNDGSPDGRSIRRNQCRRGYLWRLLQPRRSRDSLDYAEA